MFTQLKAYLIAAVTFLFGLLGAYAKYQHDKNERLSDELRDKERNIKEKEAELVEKQEAREEELTQTENVLESESQKDANSQQIKEMIEGSDDEGVTITL
jgi:hypothetical protein